MRCTKLGEEVPPFPLMKPCPVFCFADQISYHFGVLLKKGRGPVGHLLHEVDYHCLCIPLEVLSLYVTKPNEILQFRFNLVGKQACASET